MIIEFYSNI